MYGTWGLGLSKNAEKWIVDNAVVIGGKELDQLYSGRIAASAV